VQRTWDLVLQKYASLGEYEKLLQLLEELKDVGVTASAITYSQLLKQISESEKAVKLLDDLTDTVPAL
jgi:pentatricopeptide repeat protein